MASLSVIDKLTSTHLACILSIGICLGLSACGSTATKTEAPARSVVLEGAPVRAATPVIAPAPAPSTAPSTAISTVPSAVKSTVPSPAPTPRTAASSPSPAQPVARDNRPVVSPTPAVTSAAFRVPEGVYRCDEGKRVTIKQGSADARSIVANISGKDLTMSYVAGQTGALRYENVANKTVWIMTAEKAMLFDNAKGQRLADNCKL